MAYKLLTNVIAPNQIQHLTGEIVDIEDGELAKSLVERGLVEATEASATHYWTKKASVSAGGLPINAVKTEAPESSGTSQLNAVKAAQPAEAEQAPVATGLPEQSNPVPEAPSKTGLFGKAKSALGQTNQPTAEEVAQTAAEVS